MMTVTDRAICPYCKADLLELDFNRAQIRYHVWLCSQDDGLKRLGKLVATIEAEKKAEADATAHAA